MQRQFQLSRKDEFVKAFIKDAISKVVKPLSQDLDLDPEEIIEEDEDEDEELILPRKRNSIEDDWETVNIQEDE